MSVEWFSCDDLRRPRTCVVKPLYPWNFGHPLNFGEDFRSRKQKFQVRLTSIYVYVEHTFAYLAWFVFVYSLPKWCNLILSTGYVRHRCQCLKMGSIERISHGFVVLKMKISSLGVTWLSFCMLGMLLGIWLGPAACLCCQSGVSFHWKDKT